jgi:hypothetical protein
MRKEDGIYDGSNHFSECPIGNTANTVDMVKPGPGKFFLILKYRFNQYLTVDLQITKPAPYTVLASYIFEKT